MSDAKASRKMLSLTFAKPVFTNADADTKGNMKKKQPSPVQLNPNVHEAVARFLALKNRQARPP